MKDRALFVFAIAALVLALTIATSVFSGSQGQKTKEDAVGRYQFSFDAGYLWIFDTQTGAFSAKSILSGGSDRCEVNAVRILQSRGSSAPDPSARYWEPLTK